MDTLDTSTSLHIQVQQAPCLYVQGTNMSYTSRRIGKIREIRACLRINSGYSYLLSQPQHIRQWVHKTIEKANAKARRRAMKNTTWDSDLEGPWFSYPKDDNSLYIIPPQDFKLLFGTTYTALERTD